MSFPPRGNPRSYGTYPRLKRQHLVPSPWDTRLHYSRPHRSRERTWHKSSLPLAWHRGLISARPRAVLFLLWHDGTSQVHPHTCFTSLSRLALLLPDPASKSIESTYRPNMAIVVPVLQHTYLIEPSLSLFPFPPSVFTHALSHFGMLAPCLPFFPATSNRSSQHLPTDPGANGMSTLCVTLRLILSLTRSSPHLNLISGTTAVAYTLIFIHAPRVLLSTSL